MKRFARRLLTEFEDRFQLKFSWIHRYAEMFISLVNQEYDLYIFHVDNLIPSGLKAEKHGRMEKMMRLFSYIKTFHSKPIIVYSPYLKDPALREEARESGVDYVLTPPINTDMLVNAVTNALDRYKII
jgi:hypothetical protein